MIEARVFLIRLLGKMASHDQTGNQGGKSIQTASFSGAVIYDIGAGSGSVAIECKPSYLTLKSMP